MSDAGTIGLVFVSALSDVLSPTILAVFVFAISAILGHGKSSRHMGILGAAFIASFFAVHLAFGLAWAFIMHFIPVGVAQFAMIAVSFLVVFAGLLGIKDYFWYGKSISIRLPRRPTRKLQKWASSNTSLGTMIMLGSFVASIGLLITGAPYLAVTTVIGASDTNQIVALVVLYNVIFILPLAAIIMLTAGRIKITTFQRLQEKHKASLRLVSGLMCIVLGWLLLLMANGAISLG